jgi:hypothetical protein
MWCTLQKSYHTSCMQQWVRGGRVSWTCARSVENFVHSYTYKICKNIFYLSIIDITNLHITLTRQNETYGESMWCTLQKSDHTSCMQQWVRGGELVGINLHCARSISNLSTFLYKHQQESISFGYQCHKYLVHFIDQTKW